MLVLDCQWDGPPSRARPVEVAWALEPGGDVVCLLIRPDPPGSVSARFLALTGITPGEIEAGVTEEEAASALASALAGASSAAAHAGRFEERVLGDMLERHGHPRPVVACTMAMARERLPGLSGYGLGAVCGYLGGRMPRPRRAAGHVEATRFILRALSAPPASGPAPGRLVRIGREALSALPDAPGVYRLLGPSGEPIYIGRAASLRKRVPAHFTPGSWKAKDGLVSAVWGIDHAPTETVLEAVLLEADLIREQAPRANRALTRMPARLCGISPGLSGCSHPPQGRGRLLVPDGGLLPASLRAARILAGMEPPAWPAETGWNGDSCLAAEALGLLLDMGAPPGGDLREALAWASGLPAAEPGPDCAPAGVLAIAVRDLLARAALEVARSAWIGLLSCSTVEFPSGGRTRVLEFCGGRHVRRCWGGWRRPSCGGGHRPEEPGDYRRMGLLLSGLASASAGGGVRVTPAAGQGRVDGLLLPGAGRGAQS